MARSGVARARRPFSLAALDVPNRLWWALLIVIAFHGALLLFGSFRSTYDAYVHIFLADHYDRSWFSTWDFRWYTGFTTVSYPPGTHMAVAAMSRITGGLESAFAFTQLGVLLLLVVGIYRFSLLWVDRDAAANAALLLAGSSAIAQTVHLYGQLPTTFALAFLLNAIPFMARWVDDGRLSDLIVGTVVMAACTAGHHVTTLFGSVFFLGPVVVAILLDHSRTPRRDEVNRANVTITRRLVIPLVMRRLRRILPGLVRVGVLAPLILAALIIVVLPYWFWSSSDPIAQVPIPHGSRANFLADRNLGLIFFVIPWGFMLLVLPYALARSVIDRMWPIGASIGLLFVLGTGGTTPIPKLLLGPAFDVLTLDRFTFWAVILILPLAGRFVQSLEGGSIAHWIRNAGGTFTLRAVKVTLLVGFVTFTMFAATLSRYRPFQPDPIDTDPIVAFIEKDQHDRWRYLTLGFGDQMAWLSAQTTATQVDGNYHSVRRLPELTSTSVERLEGAKYRGVSGLGSLQQFLEVPEKYALKYVFSNDAFYDPLLHFLGWQNLGPLENGIVVWERADIDPLPAQLPLREIPGVQRLMWGFIPPTAIAAALWLLLWAVTGRARLPLDFTREIANRRTIVGPIRWLDNWMRRRTRPLDDMPPADLTLTARYHDRLGEVRRWASRPVPPKVRILRLVLIALVAVVVPARMALAEREPASPQEIVTAYYEDLDFRRFEEAWNRLDPVTRPNYELWRLQLSVNGGLVSSYAKLDSIDVTVTETSGSDNDGGNASDNDGREDSRNGGGNTSLLFDAPTAEVAADIRYLTSLSWHDVVNTHQLVERRGDWYLIADEPEIVIPPEQLVSRRDVEYLIQGRRQVTSETTDLADIQDRPELALTNVRLMDVENKPVIVGEVTNVDVDPADVTLTGVLRDGDNEILAQYNATEHFLRTLAPRETTSFRIEFERVAAQNEIDFDPLAVTSFTFDDETGMRISSGEVWAKAVVTDMPIVRDLQVVEPTITLVEPREPRIAASADVGSGADTSGANSADGGTGEPRTAEIAPEGDDAAADDAADRSYGDAPERTGGITVSGQIRNDGIQEATVPQVLVSYLDGANRTVWVERFYLDEAIRPQRTRDFTITLPAYDGGQTNVEVTGFANNVNPYGGAFALPALIEIAQADRDALGFDRQVARLRIDVTAFRGPGT